MDNKIVINILAISGIFLLLVVFLFEVDCLFLKLTGIPCISCGLTRGFIYILNGQFLNATKMNLLSIPIFISVLLFYIFYLVYLLLKKDYIFKYYNFFVRYYNIILIILSVNWIINIVKYKI